MMSTLVLVRSINYAGNEIKHMFISKMRKFGKAVMESRMRDAERKIKLYGYGEYLDKENS